MVVVIRKGAKRGGQRGQQVWTPTRYIATPAAKTTYVVGSYSGSKSNNFSDAH